MVNKSIICFSLVFILVLSFVSAGFFSELYSGLTGNVISSSRTSSLVTNTTIIKINASTSPPLETNVSNTSISVISVSKTATPVKTNVSNSSITVTSVSKTSTTLGKTNKTNISNVSTVSNKTSSINRTSTSIIKVQNISNNSQQIINQSGISCVSSCNKLDECNLCMGEFLRWNSYFGKNYTFSIDYISNNQVSLTVNNLVTPTLKIGDVYSFDNLSLNVSQIYINKLVSYIQFNISNLSFSCPGIACDLYCEFGFNKDVNGCEICECAKAPVLYCNDSDGKNYYVKGTITFDHNGNITTTTDFCNSPTGFLGEWLCDPSTGHALVSTYDCSLEGKICQEGKCTCVSSTNEFRFAQLSNRLNIGEGLLDVTSPPITGFDLPSVLKNETYRDKSNEEFYFIQNIYHGNLTLMNFSDLDYNNGEWTIGFKINSNQFVFNYTLNFANFSSVSSLNLSKMNGTVVKFLGHKYTVVSAEAPPSAKLVLKDILTGDKLEMYGYGNNVKFNDKTLGGLNSYFSISGGLLKKITLEWKVVDKRFLTEDQLLPMPGFSNVWYKFGGFFYSPEGGYGETYLVGKDVLCKNQEEERETASAGETLLENKENNSQNKSITKSISNWFSNLFKRK